MLVFSLKGPTTMINHYGIDCVSLTIDELYHIFEKLPLNFSIANTW